MLILDKKLPTWAQKAAEKEYAFYNLQNWTIEVKWVKSNPADPSWAGIVHKYNFATVCLSNHLKGDPYGKGCIAHEMRHLNFEVIRTVMRQCCELGGRHRSARDKEKMVDRLFEDTIEPIIEADIESRGFPRKP